MIAVWRLLAAAGMLASGALLYAASWQRWAEACPWPVGQTKLCAQRQDNIYEFLPPSDPWMPVGAAAELAGLSLLMLVVVLALLPWAMAGRRGWTGLWRPALLAVSLASTLAISVATLRSGLEGTLVEPPLAPVTVSLWLCVPPFLVGWLTVLTRGAWARAAGVLLVLALPMPALILYGQGEWDSQPWWEAISGILMGLAGLCMLVAALRRTSARPAEESSAEVAARATT